MFNLKNSNSDFLLEYNDKTLFNGLDIAINLDTHESLALTFQDITKENKESAVGKYTEHRYKFADDDGNRFDLSFHLYPDFIAAFIDMALKEGDLHRSAPSLTAKDAISVTFNNIPTDYQLMANYQHKDWWTRPYFGDNIEQIPSKTQSLLFKMNDTYHHILPVVHGDFRTDIQGTEKGLQFSTAAFQGGYREVSTVAFVIGSNNDPYELVEANVNRAIKLTNSNVKPRKEKEYPEIFDYLGWCSWDAFYTDVNEDSLFEKSEELKNLNIPAKWMMIDDGWSELKDNKLNAFEADTDKFPNGLSETVEKVKDNYSFDWIGVWHTTAGYWEGIHPESHIVHEYRDNLYQNNKGALVPQPDPEKGFGFWNAWHKQLKNKGIDFVKVDGQSAVANFFAHEMPIGEAAVGTHEALEASTSLYFSNAMINCMGMATENILSRPQSSLSRNSDDFVPSEENGFQEHALQNAYNSYYHGSFYYGDWDMYWSSNHDDKQNMILRAVSGGPIYTSDKLGETNPDHILPLVYRNGKIIRCDQPGFPTEDCLMEDPTKKDVPLKIWNKNKGTGVIAAFNISEQDAIKATISPKDIPGLQGNKFVIYNQIEDSIQVINKNEEVTVELRKNDATLYNIIPLREFITPIGLTNKLIPYDSIEKIKQLSNRMVYQLTEGGQFSFITTHNIKEILVDGESHAWEAVAGQKNCYQIDCSKSEDVVTVEIITK